MLALLIPGVGMGAGGTAAPVVPTVTTEPIRPSGGWPADQGHRRKKKDVSEARKRVGLYDEIARQEALAGKVIADVAARQVERLEQDQQKIFDELLRELQLQGLEFDARYLDALAKEREFRISQEIGQHLRRIEEEELMLMIMLAAAANDL